MNTLHHTQTHTNAPGFLTPGDARDGAGERFLRQLAAATGGTFQVCLVCQHFWVPDYSGDLETKCDWLLATA